MYLQRGHIYTSTGSFFIEPVEKYTLDNQNILHKITREKLPIDQMDFDKYRNGKMLVDEMGLHEDEDGKIVDAITDDRDIEEVIDENSMDETIINNGTEVVAPIIPCITEDGKSKYSKSILFIFYS